jgi:hypothetical protein
MRNAWKTRVAGSIRSSRAARAPLAPATSRWSSPVVAIGFSVRAREIARAIRRASRASP